MTDLLEFLSLHLGSFGLGVTVMLGTTLLAIRCFGSVAAKRSAAGAGLVGCTIWAILVWVPLRSASMPVPAISLFDPAVGMPLVALQPTPLQSAEPASLMAFVMALVMALGAGLALLWLLLGYARLRWILRSALPAPERLQRAMADWSGSTPPVFLSTRSVHVFACGLWRPCIVLPRDLADRTNERQLHALLAHEWAHIQAHDLWRQTLASWLTPLLWWNPLFHLLRREMDFASEVLADEQASQITSPDLVVQSFVRLANRRTTPMRLSAASLPALGHPSQFYRRMKMLMHRDQALPTRTSRKTRWLLATSMLILLSMTTTAWGAQSAAKSYGPQWELQFHIEDDASLGKFVTDLCIADLNIHSISFDKKKTWSLRVSAAKPKMVTTRAINSVAVKQGNPLKLFSMLGVAKVQKKKPGMSLAFDKARVDKVFDAIAKITGSNIILDPGVAGLVTIRAKNLTAREAMEMAAAQVGAVVTKTERDIYYVTPAKK